MGWLVRVEARYRPLVAPVALIFVLFGVNSTLLGATIPRIIAEFRWSYTVTAAVVSASAVGYFGSTFLAGLLIRRLGPRPVLLVGLGAQVAGLALFGAMPSAVLNALLNLLIGLGEGGMEVVCNFSIVRMERGGQGRLMSLVHAGFAVGAIVGPVGVAGLLSGPLAWQLVFRIMAGVTLGVALLMSRLPLSRLGEPADAAAGGAGGELAGLLRRPLLVLAFLILLLYVGIEMGVSKWAAEFFVKVLGLSDRGGAMMVSVFWAGLLAGRVGVSVLYHGRRQERLLLGLGVTATVTLLGVAVLTAPVAAAVALFGTGLGCSAIYPAVMTLVGKHFRRAQGPAVGFVATGGGIGAFVFPFLMGPIADHLSLRSGLLFYAGMDVVMTALIVAAAWRVARMPQPAEE